MWAARLVSDLKYIALGCDKPSAMQLHNTSCVLFTLKRFTALQFVGKLS
jgi:hypothetical protein